MGGKLRLLGSNVRPWCLRVQRPGGGRDKTSQYRSIRGPSLLVELVRRPTPVPTFLSPPPVLERELHDSEGGACHRTECHELHGTVLTCTLEQTGSNGSASDVRGRGGSRRRRHLFEFRVGSLTAPGGSDFSPSGTRKPVLQ